MIAMLEKGIFLFLTTNICYHLLKDVVETLVLKCALEKSNRHFVHNTHNTDLTIMKYLKKILENVDL